ncbi:MAG TPA: hypothetical protein VNE39_21430 [Planctomycetota bacterium]|nr:hypothetical protein [Planctomycetota bacterium]
MTCPEPNPSPKYPDPDPDLTYHIMMWGMLDSEPERWPLVASSDDIKKLRKLGSYPGTVVYARRSAYTAILLENKELTLVNPPGTHHGGIFELRRKA